MPGLSTPAFASIQVPGSFATMPGLSALASASVPVPRFSTAMPELSAAMPGLSIAVPESSTTVLGLSAPMSASITVPELSALVYPSTPMLAELSPLPFPAFSLPKTPMPDLAVSRQRLDNIIGGWSGRSKSASLEQLCSGRIKKAASEETFSPKAPLFLLLFPSSGISQRKLDKTFINTWLFANNHVEKKVDLGFAMCRCSPAV